MSNENRNRTSGRISQSSGRVRLYDAVGVDSTKRLWFVRHVGLSLEDRDFFKRR